MTLRSVKICCSENVNNKQQRSKASKVVVSLREKLGNSDATEGQNISTKQSVQISQIVTHKVVYNGTNSDAAERRQISTMKISTLCGSAEIHIFDALKRHI